VLTWIVGAGGLLGGAVSRSMERKFVGSAVPWHDHTSAIQVLDADLSQFVRAAGTDDWSLVWAAGSGVVASADSALKAETNLIESFLMTVRNRHPAGRGAFFLASSAGGVYAGSSDPPFSESTTPQPLSTYGEAKLGEEGLATRILTGRVPLLVGRLSNLFGPGQNLAKPQGLVSQLCFAAAKRQPLNLFVPMETLRDYLYVDDAAAMIRSLIAAAVRAQPDKPVLRNLSSQRPVSVAAVLRTVQQVARRSVRVGLGTTPSSRYQVRDLRVVTRFPNDFRDLTITPFPVGVKRVYDEILHHVGNPKSRSPARMTPMVGRSGREGRPLYVVEDLMSGSSAGDAG
jgi:UDP-glucose 4-epimerase